MPNYCPNCGTNVSEVRNAVCPGCGKRLPSGGPGWIARLLSRLFHPRGGSSQPITTGPAEIFARREEFRVRDTETGEVKVYHGLDELPPDVRRRVETFMRAQPTSAGRATYTYRDSAGVERTYRSLEELPPELRVLFERGGRDA